MSLHPSGEILALFSSADLPLLDRWKIRHHIAKCEYCERQLTIFRAATVELKRQSKTETLSGFEAIADWSRLEREMEGNIVVGLSAARCIEKSRNPKMFALKLSLVSGLLLLFVLGWATRVPSDQTSRIYAVLSNAFSSNRPHESAGPILRSQPGGIEVGSTEGSLTILHPANAVVSLSGTSSVEARYVDEETGQVTITDVYGQ